MNKFSTLKKWAAIIAVVAVSASDVLAQCSLTASVNDKRNVNCKGDNTGMFSLEQDGGRAPFQYSNDGGNTWQSAKNFNQLTAGTYNCVVKDRNLCTYNLTVVVTEPDFALSATTSVTNTNPCVDNACDGSITVNASGGTAPYTYSIDNGNTWSTSATFSNLCEGSYSIIVRDDNNCRFTVNASVAKGVDTEAPTAVCKSITVYLVNGAATISASDVDGGSYDNCGIVSYEISNGSFSCSNIGDNTVTLTVKDAKGNSASCDATVTVVGLQSVNAGSDATVYYGAPAPYNCTNLNAVTTGGYGTVYYTWSTPTTLYAPSTSSSLTACPTTTTTYGVSAMDASGCVVSDQVVVTAVDVRCGNKMDKVSIQHNADGKCVTICVAHAAVADHLSHGDWFGSCGRRSGSYRELSEETEVAVVPNPIQSSAEIRFSVPRDGSSNIAVYSVDGRLVANLFSGKTIAGNDYHVNLGADVLSSEGIYLIKLTTPTETKVVRVVKN